MSDISNDVVATNATDKIIENFILTASVTGSGDELHAYITDIMSTEDFTQKVKQTFNEYSRICNVIIGNQWRTYRYHQEYIAFLQGLIDKEKFQEAMEKYALAFDEDMSDEIIRIASMLIINRFVPNEEITSSDISVLLNVEPPKIEKAISEGVKDRNITQIKE